MNPDRLEPVVRAILAEGMQRMGVPGLVAIVEAPGRERVEVALGAADVGSGERMRPEHRFRLGSITKTMVATVILQLVQEGRLGLDEPLGQHLPDVETNGASIRQALGMTSGIPGYTTYPFLDAIADHPRRAWTPVELLATVAGRPAQFPPGAGWDYSNTNYVLLGLVAERAGGAALGELLAQRLFVPLGMTATTVPRPGDASMPAPFARGYQYGTRWEPDPDPPAAPTLRDVTETDPSWAFGAAGAIGTAADQVRWVRALTTGELLDPELHAQRLRFAPNDEQLPYGLGIADLGGGLIGHHGHDVGYMTQATRRASDGTVIVVLANVTQAPDGRQPSRVLSAEISRAIPEPNQPRPAR